MQHDLILDNASGAAFRADVNNALAALGSYMKGPSAPPAPIAGMVWVDDDTPSATIWTVKRYDGAEWIEEGRIDITANIYIPSEGVIAWADVASAATVDLGAQASRSLRLTGTTPITSFGTAPSGVRKRLRIATGLTITHNAISLICPGAANLLLSAGDILNVESLVPGNWVVVDFMPASGWRGSSVVLATATASGSATLDISGVFDDALFARYELEILSLVPASSDVGLALRIGTGAGPTWQAGGSAYETNASWQTNSVSVFLGGAGSGLFLTATGSTNAVGNQSGSSVSGVIELANPSSAIVPLFNFRMRYLRPTGNGGAAVLGGGFYGTSGAITGLRLLFSSGNITSGSVRLIGYRK
jgi:hypothetical protein